MGVGIAYLIYSHTLVFTVFPLSNIFDHSFRILICHVFYSFFLEILCFLFRISRIFSINTCMTTWHTDKPPTPQVGDTRTFNDVAYVYRKETNGAGVWDIVPVAGNVRTNSFALGVTVGTAQAGQGAPGHMKTLLPTLTNIQVQRHWNNGELSDNDDHWEPLIHDPYTPFPSSAAEWIAHARTHPAYGEPGLASDGYAYGSNPDLILRSAALRKSITQHFAYIAGLRNWEFFSISGHYQGSPTKWQSGTVVPYFKSDQGLFKAHSTGGNSQADQAYYAYICEELYL